MEMKDESTRLIFLKFALQCCGSPINRPRISVEDEANAIALVARGKLPEQGFEKRFLQAYGLCAITAMDMGKKEIDTDVVLEYYLQLHNPGLDRDLEMGYTFLDSIDCKVYPGTIKKTEGDSAIVDTPVGEMACRRVFAMDLKEGALVAVHRNTIAIAISEETARNIPIGKNQRTKLRGVV